MGSICEMPSGNFQNHLRGISPETNTEFVQSQRTDDLRWLSLRCGPCSQGAHCLEGKTQYMSNIK